MDALRRLTWIEMKLFAREPLTVLFVLVLPLIVLYILNGVFGNEAEPGFYEGLGPVDYYLPSYVALTVATVGVLSLPVHLAGYREQGVLRRFRASALPPATIIAAHVVIALVVGALGTVLLTALSTVAYDGPLPQDLPGSLAAFTLVTLAFAALGALLGVVMPTARAAQGLGVLLFFLFIMIGGAGPPREVLPEAMQTISDAVPLVYGARAIRGPWLGLGWDGSAVAVMVGLLVVCAVATVWRFRRLEL